MPTPTIKSLRNLKNAGILADIPSGTFPHTFKQYNLVYGFNGCGKTTLSRLIDSLAEGGINQNLAEGAEFSFALSDGANPSNIAPTNVASRQIAVFNEDYVKSALTWQEGTARPIIYLGQEQAGLAKDLASLEAEETSAAQDETLRHSEWSSAHKALEVKGRDIARLIAEEIGLGRRYTAANLKADYELRTFVPDDKLSDDERKRLKEVINRTDLPAPIAKLTTGAVGEGLEEAVSAVLSLSVEDVAIASLERRKDALAWVQEGLRIHEGEEECLFCGNDLSEDRVQRLRDALRSGFELLAREVDSTERAIDEFAGKCLSQKIALGALGETLSSHSVAVLEAKTRLESLLDHGAKVAELWRRQLAEKKANPGQNLRAQKLHDGGWDSLLASSTADINRRLEGNNAALEDFSNEQSRSKNLLKAHHLAENQSAYREAIALEEDTDRAKSASLAKLVDVRSKIAAVRVQLRSHGPAAAELNGLLKSYLGHAQISLAATDDGYRICRDGKTSRKPLSEGERTAVAFCYFLTSLQSEGRRVSDLIVVLDDPISSLDARAMTHVVALIRKKFAAVTQLFILTHNLEFMREMKKWLGKRYEKETAEFLFIETGLRPDGKRSSTVVKMPKLIRDYESEYHYLYSLVRLLGEEPEKAERFAYLMPNAIRKVLDIFLAFKDPGPSGLEPKVDKLLQDHPTLDGARVKAMERLAQLESHSENIGDVTTFSAYTLSQVADAAQCLLEMMELVDPGHKKAMDKLCS